MKYVRILLFIACAPVLLFVPATSQATDKTILTVVRPDYSTNISGQLSDRLYDLVSNHPELKLVSSAPRFQLAFALEDVETSDDHLAISLTISSTLLIEEKNQWKLKRYPINSSRGSCNRDLLEVCIAGLTNRFQHAVTVALQTRDAVQQ